MTTAIDKHTRADLQEAIREIHLVAGFAESPRGGESRPYDSFAIGVTSPDYGDGKTTISIALASSLSEDFGREVALADADFHTHSIGRQYGLEKVDGIAEVLTGTSRLESIRHRQNRGMSIIPAGRIATDPARMARSEELTQLVEKLKATSRYVVFDLPAMLHSMSAPILAQRCDGVIVVTRAGHTTRHDLERTLHLLGNAKVLGIVMNRHTTSIPGWAQRMLAIRP